MLRKAAVPDATHYVGYVEDEETPEMIMKKFEEMERIKAVSKRPVAADPQPHADPTGPSSSTAAVGTASSSGAAAGQDAAAADEEGPLDQQQLQEIFKATSMYNVKSLLGNNEALMVDAAAAKAQAERGIAADIAFDSGAMCALGICLSNMHEPSIFCKACSPVGWRLLHAMCM